MRFRLRHINRRHPAPSVLVELDRIVRAEVARRTAAFDEAFAEMDRPRLTTEQILDGYLAKVGAA